MRQRDGQHQPAPLAARQHLDGRARLLRLKQEVLHVADDVTLFPVDDHRVATPAGQRRGDASLGVELFAPLIERRHFEICAELHAAGVRCKCPGEHIDKRGLAGAVRPDEANPVATGDLDVEVTHQNPIAIALGDAPRFDDFPPGLVGLMGRHLHVGLRAVPLGDRALAAKR